MYSIESGILDESLLTAYLTIKKDYFLYITQRISFFDVEQSSNQDHIALRERLAFSRNKLLQKIDEQIGLLSTPIVKEHNS